MDKIMIAAGVLLAVIFLLPVLTGRIWNPGNQAGLCLAMLMIVNGVLRILRPAWFLTVLNFFDRTWTGIVLAHILLFLLIFIGCIILIETAAMFIAACLLHAKSGQQRKPSCKAVIVLGCRVKSLMLIQRLKAAKHFLDQNPQAICVVSGGRGERETLSEAEFMKSYLEREGIAPERIRQEDRSHSTEENLRNTAGLLREMELVEDLLDGQFKRPERVGKEGTVVIVTHEFHAYRALRTAKRFGIKARSYVAFTPIWLFPTYYLRELLGIARDWIIR